MRKPTVLMYFFIALFLVVVYIAFLIVRPFITGIMGGLILSYMFYPVYQRLFRITKMERISAFIVCILVLLIIIVPVFLIGSSLAFELQDFFHVSAMNFDVTKNPCLKEQGLFCSTYTWLVNVASDPRFSEFISIALRNEVQDIVAQTRSFVVALPDVFIQLFIAVFICYYMVRSGKSVLLKIEELLPVAKSHRKRIAQQVNSTVFGVLYGQIVVGIVQGILAMIGYYIFGVSSPILLGILTIIVSFIPVIGTAFVWFPVAIMKLISATATDSTTGIFQAVGLLAWGTFIVATIDNLIKPKIIGDKANIHPVLVLIGVLGGIALFGMMGLILGPLLLSILVELTKVYVQEREHFSE